MTTEEIKLRRLANHYLITPADKLTVVRDLCGIQSQFMTNVFHSLMIRCTDYSEDTVREGLAKNWTLRGTVHVFAEDDLPLFMHCNNGRDYRRNDWRGYTFWNRRDSWALTPERQKFFADIILKAVEIMPQSRDELKAAYREHGMTPCEEESMFDPWGGGIRELCERGFINYTVQEKKEYCLSPQFTPIPEEEAMLEIARRYFTHFAPATIHDAQYYFRKSAAEVKKWLSKLPARAAECGGKTYYYIENGKTCHHDIPKCLFLAGFDQLMLGYEKKESLFLAPENIRGIFNLAGIVMPALMLDGNVVGKYKKKDRKLTITLFEALNKKDRDAVLEKAGTLWDDLTKIEWV